MRSTYFGVILLALLYTGSVHAFPISLVFAETKAACEAVGPCRKSEEEVQAPQSTPPEGSNDDLSQDPITDTGDVGGGSETGSNNDTNNNNDDPKSGKDELIDDLNEEIVDNGPDEYMPGDNGPEKERDDHKLVAVPEPGAFALFGTGLFALLLLRRRN